MSRLFRSMARQKGRLRVQQWQGQQMVVRDFDNEEWSYQWVKRGGIDVLRLEHDADPDALEEFDFVEFSTPVSIEFEYEG